jgi:hypothetical protein
LFAAFFDPKIDQGENTAIYNNVKDLVVVGKIVSLRLEKAKQDAQTSNAADVKGIDQERTNYP